MAQETKTQQQSGPTPTDEISHPPVADEEIEEIEIPQNQTMLDKMQMVFEKFASTGVGQVVLERCDRVLKVLEETAKWSLPQDDSEAKLERPLPWLVFIPLIVWLRVIRFWLTIGSVMVGGSPVTPERMVYDIQIKRRRLRAIRVPALRATRRLETDSGAMMVGSSGKNVTLIGKLGSLFGSAVCRPGQRRDVPARRVFGATNISKMLDDKSTERSSVKRPRDDDNVDLNLTVDEMLNKYANADSEDDSDYVPNEEDDESTSSSSESISSTEGADLVKSEKAKEVTKDASKTEQALDHSVVEVKENGGPKHRPMPKPLVDIKLEPISDADSGSEQVKTPREQKSGPQNTKTTTTSSSNNTTNNTEAAPEQRPQQQPPKQMETTSTPKQQQPQHNLAVAQETEAKQKSTPGHETAASLKPAIGAKTAVAPAIPKPGTSPTFREKHYRTITTQTSVSEYDWSVVVKTEITHRKSSPVPVTKLDCSAPLTPASSTEDIFYSPIGSPQDFHSIFHPAPLVKITPAEAHSTPKETEDHNESSAPETPETHQKKNQNKQQQQHHHYNNKNRNKNRR